MKMIKLFILVLSFAPMVVLAQNETEQEAIKKVILSAYVDGLQNKGPEADIEKGFHSKENTSCLLTIFRCTNLKKDGRL